MSLKEHYLEPQRALHSGLRLAPRSSSYGKEVVMGYIVAWALGVPVTVLVIWYVVRNVL